MVFYETRSCHARRHNDLKGHSNFSSTIYSYLCCAWNITTVEINSGIHLLKSYIRQVPLFTSGGLGLGLKNLLLFTSLTCKSYRCQKSQKKNPYINYTQLSFCNTVALRFASDMREKNEILKYPTDPL